MRADAGSPWRTQYYHPDARGDVAALTDAGGRLLETYAYSPFGEPFLWDAQGKTWKPLKNSLPPSGNPLLYGARPYDADTGLYHQRARAYSPRLGRFLQQDPLGYADGANPYAYVRSSPYMYGDYSGKNAVILLAAVAVTAVGAYFIAALRPQENRNIGLTDGDGKNIKNQDLFIKYLNWAKENSDSFALVSTTPFATESQGLRSHTEIVFLSGGIPVSSIGSAYYGGWKIKGPSDAKKYFTFGKIIDSGTNVDGCLDGLRSYDENILTNHAAAGFCWASAASCINGANDGSWGFGVASHAAIVPFFDFINAIRGFISH